MKNFRGDLSGESRFLLLRSALLTTRNRGMRRQHRGPLFGYPLRLRSGLRQNWAGFLQKRERWRTPSWLVPTIKGNPRYALHFDVDHLPVSTFDVLCKSTPDRLGRLWMQET